MIRKLLSFFTRKEINIAIFIFILVVIGAGLEVFSLSLFALFIGLFLDNNLEVYQWIINNSLIDFTNKDESELIKIIGIVTGLLFLFKNSYLLYINFLLHRFIYNKYTQLSVQLLRKYIAMPYINHLETNSSFLQRNVNTEVFWLFANIFVPGITLLTELVIVTVVILALFYVNPLSTLLLIISFALLLSLIMITIKRKMDLLGSISQSYFGEMIKSVDQSLGGIKVTKVSGTQQFFLDVYRSNIEEYSQNTARLKNISQWPRYLVEVILVVAVVISAIYMSQGGADLAINLSVLSFFAMAGIRLMPSFNRITSAYTNIRYYSASLNVIFDELVGNAALLVKQPNSKKDISFKKDIEFQNISFNYPGVENNSIRGLSFKIKKGNFISFIGRSGSGKTTIVDLLCGLLEANDGEILVDGKCISNNLLDWQKLISYVPQEIYLLDDSLRNNIAYGVKPEEIDNDLIKYVSKLAMIDSYIDDLELGYETRIGENGVKMSGGQRQRLGIARALYEQPEILILDEGTAALDNKSQEYIINSINSISSNITVIAIAHRLDTIKNSDSIFLIEDGELKKYFNKKMIANLDENFSEIFD
jgi:ATP-binding cassette, subfamily B, bacterial PglK